MDSSPSNRADAAGNTGRPLIRGTRHVCVSGHYLAAHAGFSILEAGGNAVDAGIAAAITETVVQSEQVGFAGIAPMMIYLAKTREVVTVAGVGTWPRASSCELLESRHEGHVPRGVLRSVVPGAPAAWILALQRYGTMSFSDVASAALRFAREGFPLHPYNAEQIRRNAADYREWPQNAQVWLPGGEALQAGDLFVQTELGNTIAFLCDCERAAGAGGRLAALQAVHDAFYAGDIAQAIANYHRDNGGWITRQDLASYEAAVEPTVRGDYQGFAVHTCGFWTQGPALIQILNILEAWDLQALGRGSAGYLHLLIEAVKLAFSDRHAFYADPAHVEVPAHSLLSKEYARARASLVQAHSAWEQMPPPGDFVGDSGCAFRHEPPIPTTRSARVDPAPGMDTTYCCAVDREGNVFSASPSDTSSDSPVIPGTGFCVSPRGTQAWGRRDNVNCVAPGKRPRVTPNPVMIFRGGRPVMALGTPGGDVQPQAVLQVLLANLLFGLDPQAAVEAPRFVSWSFPNSREPHDYHAGLVALEGRLGREVGNELSKIGHRVSWWPDRTARAGGVCVVRMDARHGLFEAAADPRRAGYAVGW